MSARALFGGLLREGILVRLIYLDEAGTSRNEPVAVVAAAIFHPDKQWRNVDQYLSFLRKRYGLKEDFIFHATELFSGGKVLDRKNWPAERRIPILKRVLSIPRKFDIPIMFGFYRQDGVTDADTRHHSAFALCLKRANDFIKDKYDGEVATVVAENVSEMRRWLAKTPDVLKNPPSTVPELGRHPFDAVVDQIHFADKQGAPLLQVADAVAFAIRLFMTNHRFGRRTVNFIADNAAIWDGLDAQNNVIAGMGAIYRPKSESEYAPVSWEEQFF
ncbi:MAG TPA: DUF3800 domain-containing protein [Rudaea sp.]|jgi:hypothetical protein